MTADIEIILWRDIPAQVIAREGRDVHRVELSPRFQQAIDQAAARAGMVENDDYLGGWRKEKHSTTHPPETAAPAEVERVESLFTVELLARYVANGGRRP